MASGGLEGQATPSVTLLQIPPAGASDGMGIGVLLPVLAPIVGFRISELPRIGAWIPPTVGVAVVWMPSLCHRGICRGNGRGRESDRQQSGNEKSHGRFSASTLFKWCRWRPGSNREEETQSAGACAEAVVIAPPLRLRRRTTSSGVDDADLRAAHLRHGPCHRSPWVAWVPARRRDVPLISCPTGNTKPVCTDG
jgi:hypothetical protein